MPRSLLVILLLGTLGTLSAVAAVAAWEEKVDPWVLQSAGLGVETEFLVLLSERADLSGAATLSTKLEKGRYVFRKLTGVADRTQPPVAAALAAAGVEFRGYWITNMFWVRGDLTSIRTMAERADVAHVYANPTVALEQPVEERTSDGMEVTIEPNLEFVGAPAFWDAGFFGEGVVLGNQDTGMDWDHPALKQQYRGWDGDSADHNYAWHDAIHSGGGSCGADSLEPCDDNGHGTLTTGVMVGDDGAGNQIGMAPAAQWIGCRNMDQGNGTPATYSECFQFFIAPTDLADENPNPDMAPHAINNSWSCPPSEGCTDPDVMLEVVENTRAAGIAVVVSAQNSGPSCSSVDDPAAIYEAAWSIGSTDNAGEISDFSARGPVAADGSNRLKPDVVAPGESIRTSSNGGGYTAASGTSLSSPHVAGLVALLISAEGCFAGDVAGMENYVKATTLPTTTSENCGDVPGSEVPNNTYGYGSIQAELPTSMDCSMSAQIAGDCPGELTITLTGATPNGAVGLPWSSSPGSALVPAGACANAELGLEDPRLLRFIQADDRGESSFTGPAPAAACGGLLQAVDMESCRISTIAAAPE